MVHGSQDTVGFRLWPPVAIGLPLLAGWLATAAWGDPVDLGGWRVPLGWLLGVAFVGWNGWSLWLFARHDTGLLPGQSTNAMIEEGPYRLSRNPLYVGLLALYLAVALLAPVEPADLADAERAGRLVRLGGLTLSGATTAVATGRLATLPPRFSAGDAARALGTSRRVAIPVLERLDALLLTRRHPDGTRTLRPVPHPGE